MTIRCDASGGSHSTESIYKHYLIETIFSYHLLRSLFYFFGIEKTTTGYRISGNGRRLQRTARELVIK